MSKSKESGSYRDDPRTAEASSSSAIPLLLQSDADDVDHAGERLPGYSEQAVQAVEGQDRDRDRPPGFEVYRPEVRRITTCLGAGDTLTVSHDVHLNNDGEALYRWLVEENKKPPRVFIRVQGSHQERRREGNRTDNTLVTDFDIRLDVTYCLMELNGLTEPTLALVDPGEKAHRGRGRFKSVAKDLEDMGTVRDWADQYCEDQSILKEFVMKKVVIGHDHECLERELKALIRSTNYLGNITVSFPILETHVEVYPSNRISRLRKSELCRWIFYLTFLWIFAWPVLWFMTKRYHVTRSIWRMSITFPTPDAPDEPIRHSAYNELTWLNSWGPAIKRAAKARRQGELTEHDLREIEEQQQYCRAGGVIRAPAPTGNSTVDGALGFIAGIGGIVSDYRNSRDGVIGWGGDTDTW